jgi:hypothetical protein
VGHATPRSISDMSDQLCAPAKAGALRHNVPVCAGTSEARHKKEHDHGRSARPH